MITVNGYLNFPGTGEEAFGVYAKILGGKVGMIMRFGDMPDMPGNDPTFRDKVMHISMTLGDFTLMGSDAPPPRYNKPQGFCVNLGLDDPSEADRIYAALAEGGVQTMPITETFWAKRFGMCTDRFGIPWMINCEKAA